MEDGEEVLVVGEHRRLQWIVPVDVGYLGQDQEGYIIPPKATVLCPKEAFLERARATPRLWGGRSLSFLILFINARKPLHD